jgi:hypothetical protein
MRAWFMVVLALGCNGKPEDSDETAVDTDPDLPDLFLGYTEKPSDVERAGDAVTAGLVQVRVEADGRWTVLGHLASEPVSGTGNFAIELPEAPEATAAEDLGGGRRGTLYVPIVYDDSNRDGTFQDGADDLVLGFNQDRWLAYISQPASGDPAGWAVVDRSGETWAFYPLTTQAVVRLRGLTAEARIEGIYEGLEEGVGVVAVDERLVSGDTYSTWIPWQSSIADNGVFDAKVNSRPPVDAFQFPEGSVRYVRALALFYRDADASGSFTWDEVLVGQGLCYKGQPLYARFSDTPRTLAVAREIDRLGWTTGWRFVTGAYGAETEVPRGDMRFYRYKDDCPVSLPEK